MTESLSDNALCTSQAALQPAADLLPPILSRWWVAFAASSVFVVGGHLLIKVGLNNLAVLPVSATLAARVLHPLLNPTVLAGLIIYVMGTVCWMRAVSQKEISFLYPLSSVNFVLISAMSMLLLHEDLSIRRISGVAMVMLGMILMNTGSRETRT
jgi:multidrug transporter EmrE-like cation transporter